MKSIILAIFILSWQTLCTAQDIKSLVPIDITPLNFSKEMIANFNSPESWKKCDSIYQLDKVGGYTKKDQEILQYCEETRLSIWDIIGGGCSWYCGGGPREVSASSRLDSSTNINYEPENAHDLNYKTAWVEGIEGYGIGEYLEYTFDARSPRITNIIVCNGYVKSAKAWKENSRVKKLKLHFNNTPIAILNLEDSRSSQSFSIDTIGSPDRSQAFGSENKPDWKLKFEILEVYKGDKYDDVVISEIYFDGIDVHCLAKGTEILISKNETKSIEDLAIGDTVMSLDSQGNFVPDKVESLANPFHKDLIQISLRNGSNITCTTDHPLLSTNHSWVSYSPRKTMYAYQYSSIAQLSIGTKLITPTGEVEVEKIEIITGTQQTYTIVKLYSGNKFIANGIVVGTEELNYQ